MGTTAEQDRWVAALLKVPFEAFAAKAPAAAGTATSAASYGTRLDLDEKAGSATPATYGDRLDVDANPNLYATPSTSYPAAVPDEAAVPGPAAPAPTDAAATALKQMNDRIERRDAELRMFADVAALGRRVNEAASRRTAERGDDIKIAGELRALNTAALRLVEQQLVEPELASAAAAGLSALADQLATATGVIEVGETIKVGDSEKQLFTGNGYYKYRTLLDRQKLLEKHGREALRGAPSDDEAQAAKLRADLDALTGDAPGVQQFKADAQRALDMGTTVGTDRFARLATGRNDREAAPGAGAWDEETEQERLLAQQTADSLAMRRAQPDADKQADRATFGRMVNDDDPADLGELLRPESVAALRDDFRASVDEGGWDEVDAWLDGVVAAGRERVAKWEAATPAAERDRARAERQQEEQRAADEAAAEQLAAIRQARREELEQAAAAVKAVGKPTLDLTELTRIVNGLHAFADRCDQASAARDAVIADAREGVRYALLLARTVERATAEEAAADEERLLAREAELKQRYPKPGDAKKLDEALERLRMTATGQALGVKRAGQALAASAGRFAAGDVLDRNGFNQVQHDLDQFYGRVVGYRPLPDAVALAAALDTDLEPVRQALATLWQLAEANSASPALAEFAELMTEDGFLNSELKGLKPQFLPYGQTGINAGIELVRREAEAALKLTPSDLQLLSVAGLDNLRQGNLEV